MSRVLCAYPRRFTSISSFNACLRRFHDAPVQLPLAHPALCIWGANTGVGKTLVSAALAAAALRAQACVLFLKPVQTGHPRDSDVRLVEAAAATAGGDGRARRRLTARALHTYTDPVGPHLAAAREGRVVSDDVIAGDVRRALGSFQAQLPAAAAALSLVETAGGVASPGPSGALQADILRALRLPALLVGDARLGGISATISAYESLLLRGHDVVAVALMREPSLDNFSALQRHFSTAAAHRMGAPLPVVALPLCRPPAAPAAAGGGVDAELAAWLEEGKEAFDGLLEVAVRHHAQRLACLRSAAARAAASVWWPFTQHANLALSKVTVVDARAGEDWQVFDDSAAAAAAAAAPPPSTDAAAAAAAGAAPLGARPRLVQLHDACASWWTQTMATSALQGEVTRAAAAAAGRYAHVLWPETAHAPGLALTEALLASPLGAGWAGRAFFSDDGSTAVEVALKMAFRKHLADSGGAGGVSPAELQVVALTNGYHGDTLGAMDCAAPSAFNGPLQAPWYRGRGLFLDPPHLALQDGRWRISLPAWLATAAGEEGGVDVDELSFATREEAMCPARSSPGLRALYRRAVTRQLDRHQSEAGVQLGALLLEPVLQGAGGMLCVDPDFQRALVQVCRERRIPVIYDEVFTGCWRLGAPSGAAILGEPPDIACYAKLLTAGVAPLAVTLASAAVFDVFRGQGKAEALLHGHSFTAYPVGCAAALASLHILQNRDLNPNLAPHGWLHPQWSDAVAARLSAHPLVRRVVALGSVLAVEVGVGGRGGGELDGGGGGYLTAGQATAELVRRLRARGVFVRPLGPVVYVMVCPTSAPETCRRLEAALEAALDECVAGAGEVAGEVAAPDGLWMP